MTDDEVLAWAKQFDAQTLKDIYVFRMAEAQIKRPGARTRAINAARRLHEIVTSAPAIDS